MTRAVLYCSSQYILYYVAICSQNCDSFNGQVCGTCREGYEKVPRCCNCTSDRVKMGDECVCPGNKVPVNGVCQCPPGTTETGDNVCTSEFDFNLGTF